MLVVRQFFAKQFQLPTGMIRLKDLWLGSSILRQLLTAVLLPICASYSILTRTDALRTEIKKKVKNVLYFLFSLSVHADLSKHNANTIVTMCLLIYI